MPINANLKQLAEEEERDEAMATVGRKKFGVLGNAAFYKTQLGQNISLAERKLDPPTIEEIKWKANWYEQAKTDPSDEEAVGLCRRSVGLWGLCRHPLWRDAFQTKDGQDDLDASDSEDDAD